MPTSDEKVDPRLWYCYERPRPQLRGVLHAVAFYLSPLVWWILLSRCHTTGTTVTALMSLTAASSLFWCSSAFHRGDWHSHSQLPQEHRAAALDLGCISLMISFSIAPCYAALLPQAWSWKFIVLTGAIGVWSAISHSRACDHGRKTGTMIYIIQGILATAPMLIIEARLIGFEKLYLAIAGASYLSGASIYANESPDPWPKTFGYHEIWHCLVVLAASMTMAANSSVLGRMELMGGDIIRSS